MRPVQVIQMDDGGTIIVCGTIIIIALLVFIYCACNECGVWSYLREKLEGK